MTHHPTAVPPPPPASLTNREVAEPHSFAELKVRLERYLDGLTPLCEVLWLEDLTIERLFLVVKKNNLIINIRPLLP
jgi:hypothetical protein